MCASARNLKPPFNLPNKKTKYREKLYFTATTFMLCLFSSAVSQLTRPNLIRCIDEPPEIHERGTVVANTRYHPPPKENKNKKKQLPAKN